MVTSALVVALAVCGWFVVAMPPFGVESSAATFSVAAAMLAASAVLTHRSSLAFDLRVREPNLGQPLVPALDRAPTRAPACVPGETIGDTSLRLRGTLTWLLAVLLALAVSV